MNILFDRKTISILPIIFLIFFCTEVKAETITADSIIFESIVAEPQRYEEVSQKSFNHLLWENFSREFDYEEEEVSEAVKSSGPIFSLEFLSRFQPLFYIIIVVLLALIIIKLFGATLFSENKKIKMDAIIKEDIANNIHEIDLYQLLKDTLSKQDFKLAIRIYYLIIIKQLAEKGDIKWKKDKTNWEYLQEMRNNQNFNTFMGLTATFERIWYGNSIIERALYEQIIVQFEDFNTSIK